MLGWSDIEVLGASPFPRVPTDYGRPRTKRKDMPAAIGTPSDPGPVGLSGRTMRVSPPDLLHF